MVGSAHADARTPLGSAKDRDLFWRIKAKTSEELRQEFLGIYVPRIRELGLEIPDPELRLDPGTGRVAVHRAGLGRAADGRDRSWAGIRGTGRLPSVQLGCDGLGAGDRPRGASGRGVTDESPADRLSPDEPGVSELEPFEVFRQEKDGGPMVHGGSVMAPDAELAVHYAREMYGRRQESVRLWVVRRTDVAVLEDPDLLQPPLDRSFKKPGGYVMRDKLAVARERSGTAKRKASDR